MIIQIDTLPVWGELKRSWEHELVKENETEFQMLLCSQTEFVNNKNKNKNNKRDYSALTLTLSQRERGLPSPFGRRAGDEGKEYLTHPIFVDIDKDLNSYQ